MKASARSRTPFGQRMRDARTRAGLTQVQASEALSLTQGTLSQLESSALSSGHVAQVARLYGCDAHWLATGEGAPSWEGEQTTSGVRVARSGQEIDLLDAFRWLTEDEKVDLVADLVARRRRYEEVTRRALRLDAIDPHPPAEVGRAGAGREEMQAGLDLMHRLHGVPTPAEARAALESTPEEEPASMPPTPRRPRAKSR